MKIKAKVSGENLFLLDALNKKGVKSKLVKRGLIVELPVLERSANRVVYEIPAEVNDAQLGIDLAENGGGLTRTGCGTIVCGLQGQPLKPYYIPRRGHLACGEHAYFLVLGGAVVTITAYRRDDKIKIEEHCIVRDKNAAFIESKNLWEGQIGELPELMSHFQAAVEAAYEKANCFHCRHAHFIEVS